MARPRVRRSTASARSRSHAASQSSSESVTRVAFLHPNLGIGGAERLIVDCASALQQYRGPTGERYRVHLFTNYHDRGHCYEETRDGTLPVTVYGKTRDHFLGRFRVLIAILRMTYLTLLFAWRHARDFDVIIVDQISHAIPILRWTAAAPILFYCHFPDQAQAAHDTLVKRVYRYPFDRAEEWTTGLAHRILCNSQFTLDTFRRTFPRLAPMIDDGRVDVLYPSIDFARYVSIETKQVAALPERREIAVLDQIIYGAINKRFFEAPVRQVYLLTSINRFERKKNIRLAIEAFAALQRHLSANSTTATPNASNKKSGKLAQMSAAAAKASSSSSPPGASVRLLITGGYDPVNIENREHYDELWQACIELGLQPIELRNTPVTRADGAKSMELVQVTSSSSPSSSSPPIVYFLRSFTDVQRAYLLTHSLAVLYTPTNEHFGIVPIEAMFMRRPVIACRSGGPMESIVDYNDANQRSRATGFLCAPTTREWTDAMRTLVEAEWRTVGEEPLSWFLGARGHTRVLAQFHFTHFQQEIVRHIRELHDEHPFGW